MEEWWNILRNYWEEWRREYGDKEEKTRGRARDYKK